MSHPHSSLSAEQQGPADPAMTALSEGSGVSATNGHAATLDRPPFPATSKVGDLLRRHPVVVPISSTISPQTGTFVPHPDWVGVRRVVLVSPCFNRTTDAELLVDDLLKIDRRGVDFRMVLVDNASDKPLSQMRVGLGADGPVEPWFKLEHLRQEINAGGSGGYNAGLRRALEYALPATQTDSRGEPGQAWVADYIWMVDSDVRMAPDTLWKLIKEMEHDREIVAAGSTLADPLTGQGFELGGHVNRKSGWWEPHAHGVVGIKEILKTDYLAACCALIRAEAIRMTGVMPDNFLHGDDVEWTRRMQDITGGKAVCVPWAFAMHPHFSRFATWTRYYTGRSAFGTLAAVNRGFKVRFKRAMVEVRRAVQQTLNDREDLGRLHVRALLDASRGVITGKAADGIINVIPHKPLKKLSEELGKVLDERGLRAKAERNELRVRVLPNLMLTHKEEAEIFAQLRTLGIHAHDRHGRYHRSFVGEMWDLAMRFTGLAKRPDIAIAPARGQAFCWLAAPIMVQVWTGSCIVRQPKKLPRMWAGAKYSVLALCAAFRAALATPPQALMYAGRLARPRPELPSTRGDIGSASVNAPNALPRVTAVVLSHNRFDALERTVESLLSHPLFEDPSFGNRVLIVDNGSSDGTADKLAAKYGESSNVDVLLLDANIGVEAFNRGVNHAIESQAEQKPELVLILDDDARVEPSHLVSAVELMGNRTELGAVTFHPRHPDTSVSEWAFANQLRWKPTDRWPVMGCANLVRTDVWQRVGGYESSFFLYRNDTDLALKVLGASEGPHAVHFNPRWVVWHDTPNAGTPNAPKSARWHRFATRNWVWLCRRHGRGLGFFGRTKSALLGCAWAHRLAGLSPARQFATLRGSIAGFITRAPSAPATANTGSADGLNRLIAMQFAERKEKRRERRKVV